MHSDSEYIRFFKRRHNVTEQERLERLRWLRKQRRRMRAALRGGDLNITFHEIVYFRMESLFEIISIREARKVSSRSHQQATIKHAA